MSLWRRIQKELYSIVEDDDTMRSYVGQESGSNGMTTEIVREIYISIVACTIRGRFMSIS